MNQIAGDDVSCPSSNGQLHQHIIVWIIEKWPPVEKDPLLVSTRANQIEGFSKTGTARQRRDAHCSIAVGGRWSAFFDPGGGGVAAEDFDGGAVVGEFGGGGAQFCVFVMAADF